MHSNCKGCGKIVWLVDGQWQSHTGSLGSNPWTTYCFYVGKHAPISQ